VNGGVATWIAKRDGPMEDSTYMRMTMESGSVYEYEHGIVVITPSEGGPKYAIKAWQFFAFDPEETFKWDGLIKFMDTAERKDPAVGRRVLVYGKDNWRISTKIVKMETNE
jgi:hypothetical protein